ncbi:MAG: alanine racemase [Sphingomonadaceae bacterium]|nr:alanine racemase [Sphingomonadaceae bacterium]
MHEATAATLRIDLGALVDNYRLIQHAAAPAAVAGVVKADAYGLGAVEISGAIFDAGCRHFFVAHLCEAMALRPHLPPAATLYVLNGLHPGAEAECAAIDVVPVLNSLEQVDAWSACARTLGRSLPAVLQVDTGMSRLGLMPQDATALAAQPHRLDHVDLLLLMSHLACADHPDDAFNQQQWASFRAIADLFPGVPLSLDNSGGALAMRPDHGDLVRAGIALYGGAPHDSANPMRPVIALDAYIIQLRRVPAGTGVGYGLAHRCDRPSHIATISVGYADGWPRNLGSVGGAFIDGVRAPIVGRVSMDSMTIDVTDVPDHLLYPGAPVELIGPHQSIDAVATQAGTISYEILTRLGRRYGRDYLPVPNAASTGAL